MNAQFTDRFKNLISRLHQFLTPSRKPRSRSQVGGARLGLEALEAREVMSGNSILTTVIPVVNQVNTQDLVGKWFYSANLPDAITVAASQTAFAADGSVRFIKT
jgi:hypothetical protein